MLLTDLILNDGRTLWTHKSNASVAQDLWIDASGEIWRLDANSRWVNVSALTTNTSLQLDGADVIYLASTYKPPGSQLIGYLGSSLTMIGVFDQPCSDTDYWLFELKSASTSIISFDTRFFNVEYVVHRDLTARNTFLGNVASLHVTKIGNPSSINAVFNLVLNKYCS